MPSYRELARNHDFTALWVGATVAELGTRVSIFAMPLVAYAMTRSAFWAATAEAVHLIGMVGMLLPAGVIADRSNRLRVMRVTHGSGALLYASLAIGGLLGSLTLPHLLLVALLTGALNGLFIPAENSAIRSVVTADQLPTALSQQQARQHIAGLLGGPLGGVLLGLARWAPFAGNAVAYAAGWLLLGRVRADLTAPPAAQTVRRPAADLVAGLRYGWRQPVLRTLLFFGPAANLALNALFFLALLRLVEAGFPAWQIGLAEATIGACGILGALAAPWLIDRVPTGRLATLCAWSFVPLSIPLAFWTHPAVMALAASVGLFLNPAANAGLGSYRMAITPPELVGRVQSAAQFVSMLSIPVAPALAGLLLSTVDGPTAVLIVTALIAAAALIPTLSRTVRSIPRPDLWPRPEATTETDSPHALQSSESEVPLRYGRKTPPQQGLLIDVGDRADRSEDRLS
ncbi:putative MFS family arabinose efflux permease [Nocardioides albertanoniae]|uniref:Putative MFS family arabinose efflux permease n=1 Tax=Nocardioides albertanoniae TaxID=1175486 RepID=A0A543AAT8_9ACTN|nr:MFS transporter [Nocardioides albertanoniae]TQL69685.1 putative MFS family arabinose efflux permease [Nocardioides albertanoniae]